MDQEKIIEQYRIVIVKIIDYLGEQQKKNNINENIPVIDMDIKKHFDSDVQKGFNHFFKGVIQYQEFYATISREFFEELKEGGPLYDGILIADLNLCKKRVINEDENKDSYGSIRVNDNGIYFEEKANNKKPIK